MKRSRIPERGISETFAELDELLDMPAQPAGDQLDDLFELDPRLKQFGRREGFADAIDDGLDLLIGAEDEAIDGAERAQEIDRFFPTIGEIGVADAPPRDEVDGFLDSRTSLFQVVLVGTSVHVTLPLSHEWTSRYTSRALTLAAVAAAIRAIYGWNVPFGKIKKAHDKVVGHGVKYTPATQQKHGKGAVHMTIIEGAPLTSFEDALNFSPEHMHKLWRERRGEAKMLEFALGSAYKSFDKLKPYFSEKERVAGGITADLIRYMLDKRVQSMIEVAKRHPAAAPWRAAFKRNLDLTLGRRGPTLKDFDKVPLSQWAKTVLELAVATRKVMVERFERQRAEDKRHARNEHLRPHEIKVTDPAAFVLKTFDPTREERLDPYSWIVRGGQLLSNAKNEKIYLLSVDSRRVVYQNHVDKRFYEQTLEGFGQELLYGVYTAAGQKSQGAIALTKWVIGIAGAVFPPVRYTVLATDVLNAAFKLQANRKQLERSYDGIKLAYRNIDALVPGMLPKVWDAVLDKENAALFNPLQNPDVGAWLKVVIRVVMMRQARVVSSSYAGDAVIGFFNKVWAAIKKGLKALLEVMKHVIVVTPAVVGSTGVSGHRALDLAERKLKDLGVVQAAALVAQIKALPKDDQKRLVREIGALWNNGTKLIDIIKKAMSW